jgi:penicillin amidase
MAWSKVGRVAVLVAIVGLAAVPVGPATAARKGLGIGSGPEAATIVRDGYGVPNIYANQAPGMWYGAGYAQAQDRLVQMEFSRRTAEGTLAAILGPDLLSQDEFIRTLFYTTDEMQSQFQSLPTWIQDALTAYSDGVNAYLAKAYASAASRHARVPYEFFVLGSKLGMNGPYRPANWTPLDTVAIGDAGLRQFGSGGTAEVDNLKFLGYLKGELGSLVPAVKVWNDTLWINDPHAPTIVPSGANAVKPPSGGSVFGSIRKLPAHLRNIPMKDVVGASAVLNRDRTLAAQTGQRLQVPWHEGSNAIAISPSRSTDGHALLWGAPQQGFGTPSVDYEEYLHGPAFDVGGIALPGEPFVIIGHNENIAWTLTSGELFDSGIYIDLVDMSKNPPIYYYKGKTHKMQVIPETIDVAGGSPEQITVLRTVHGPVVFADGPGGIAFTVHFATWMRELGTVQGLASFDGASNLTQFRDSVSKFTAEFNLTYADTSGNIAYYFGGSLPILPSCSNKWYCDPRLPHWGDGTQEWQGFEPFHSLPHVVNPAQGFVENWNTKPDQAHYYQQNNASDDYWGTIYKSSRIADIIRSQQKLDLSSLTAIEHDIGTIDRPDVLRPAAPYFLPYLFDAYQKLVAAGDPLVDPTTHPDLAASIQALQAWDGHTAIGSNAMYLFVEWMDSLQRNLFGGGLNSGELYTGPVSFANEGLGLGNWLGYATYNLTYHILSGTHGLVPCGQLCYKGGYFGGNRDQILVESVNDAIGLLSGTGPLLGNYGAHGFGTTDVSAWTWQPYPNIDWNQLDPLAEGITLNLPKSPEQERSTYMQAIDLSSNIAGINVVAPGESAFINEAGQPSPNFGDQIGLFNAFEYKPMNPT